MSASHPCSNTRTNEEHIYADGSQAEEDKALRVEYLNTNMRLLGVIEEAETAVDSGAGSKAVSSVEKRTCSICFKIVYSKGNMKAQVKKHH